MYTGDWKMFCEIIRNAFICHYNSSQAIHFKFPIDIYVHILSN